MEDDKDFKDLPLELQLALKGINSKKDNYPIRRRRSFDYDPMNE
jgi:hypothetical protein